MVLDVSNRAVRRRRRRHFADAAAADHMTTQRRRRAPVHRRTALVSKPWMLFPVWPRVADQMLTAVYTAL